MTIVERIATVAAVQGVISASQKGQAKAEGDVHLVTVVWFRVSGAVASRGGGVLVVSDMGGENEEAYWGELPALLAPAPTAQGYITERTVLFTASDVIDYVNAKWRAQSPAYAVAPDILGIEIDNQDGKSVKISGLFWMENGTRSPKEYIIRFVDANGAIDDKNVKLELIA